MKFCVVPEPSERATVVIAPAGSAVPLSAVIAGSDQSVICRLKILAIVSPESLTEVVPGMLTMIATPSR